ncbi:hypothetical protein PMIN01_08407 [Paraphaeosphaeria minitans]|uniref:Uncharacterized protein n=1 Tax=Paraphaeosphaeria minitans TaxID=565426 RepID=A0A9P6KNX0_9PLEO|nr:hypothetical protein PMIN01_08407 [Paraphaeosphaeria minitans]
MTRTYSCHKSSKLAWSIYQSSSLLRFVSLSFVHLPSSFLPSSLPPFHPSTPKRLCRISVQDMPPTY